MKTPKIASTFHFPNGMLATCGEDGQQLPEFQGRFSEYAQKVLDAADTDTKFHGWLSIPDGTSLSEKELESMRSVARVF